MSRNIEITLYNVNELKNINEKAYKNAIAENIGCEIDDIGFYSIESIKEITRQVITYSEMK